MEVPWAGLEPGGLAGARGCWAVTRVPAQGEFCVAAVREGLVVAFLRWLCRTARAFAESPPERGAPAAPPALLLLLARLCLDYEATTISYVLTLTDEQFPPQVSPKLPGGPCLSPRGHEVALCPFRMWW